MSKKSGLLGDKSSTKSDHCHKTHKDGSVTHRGSNGSIRDKDSHIASEYERHGWKVEYSSESEEGFSKKA